MAQVCAFNICPAFQSSDVSLILGLRSDPYFLSLESVANSVSVRFASGVHDFSPAFVLLASDFLTLQNFNPCFFCRSRPYWWCWFQCLCRIHWRIFKTTSLFDWWALWKLELLSKGEEDPCSSQYTSRHYWTWCTSNVSDPSWSQWAWRIWRSQERGRHQ